MGGARPVGTSCLIEDVAFAVEDLPEATVKLQRLIADHGYRDACIYGHAFEGNYHFIINQLFSDESVKPQVTQFTSQKPHSMHLLALRTPSTVSRTLS